MDQNLPTDRYLKMIAKSQITPIWLFLLVSSQSIGLVEAGLVGQFHGTVRPN